MYAARLVGPIQPCSTTHSRQCTALPPAGTHLALDGPVGIPAALAAFCPALVRWAAPQLLITALRALLSACLQATPRIEDHWSWLDHASRLAAAAVGGSQREQHRCGRRCGSRRGKRGSLCKVHKLHAGSLRREEVVEGVPDAAAINELHAGGDAHGRQPRQEGDVILQLRVCQRMGTGRRGGARRGVRRAGRGPRRSGGWGLLARPARALGWMQQAMPGAAAAASTSARPLRPPLNQTPCTHTPPTHHGQPDVHAKALEHAVSLDR